jgi:molecular chaperone DnaK
VKIVGIDLGTTNSCVYYLDDDGNPVLVIDSKSRKIFPSVVWCAGPGKEIVVGHKAKSRLGQQPAPVAAVKRKMGTTEKVRLGQQDVSPVEVSAHILSYAKQLVEETTGDQVGGVVVTMPAYFNAAPKNDTYEAAVRAFFGGDAEAARGRLELQLEPVAAAFAYILEDPAERLRILVYDLGGGTFDVTLLDKSPEGGLTVLKFGGDPHLGGDNVDDRVASWFLYLLRGGKPEALDRILAPGRYAAEKQHTLLQQLLTNDTAGLRGELRPEDQDLKVGAEPRYALNLEVSRPEDLERIQTLKVLAENAKINLSVSTETPVSKQGAFMDQEGEIVDVDLSLSRSEFNRLIGDMIARTVEETARVVAASGLTFDQIDRIVLVGGSTRMPVVHEELEKVFRRPVQMADPDLIVARGAALRARELSLLAGGEGSGGKISLEYPRQTPEARINIKGQVSQPLSGHRVYLSREGEDLSTAAVNGDRFLLTDVRLVRNAENVFHLEVADEQDNLFAATELTVRHSDQAIGSTGPLTTPLTKPIKSRGVRGFAPILEEGTPLPASKAVTCSRATQDDHIVIEFYEGEHRLTDLRIEGFDPSLPRGAAIDVVLTIEKDYTGNATATIRETGHSATAAFSITRLQIPPVETMDQDLKDVLEEIENDLEPVRDPNLKAGFSRRARRLAADYRKARRELTRDHHHLYTIVGELRKVLIEIRGAHDVLEPPFEVLGQLARLTRGAADPLDGTSAIPKQDALEKISSLERAGKEAWDQQDAPTWKSIIGQLEKFKDDLERASRPAGPSPRQMPPELIQREILSWLGGLRQRAAENEMRQPFDNDIDGIERAVRHVDLRHGDQARDALLQIVHEQIMPLDHRMERAVREAGGSVTHAGDRVYVDW